MKKLFLIAPIVMSGCIGTMVPMTKVKGSIAGQPFELDSPKDSTLTGLEITAGTNGVSVKIQTLTAKMNPDIITTTGDAQAKLISTAVAAGAAVAGQVAGAAAK